MQSWRRSSKRLAITHGTRLHDRHRRYGDPRSRNSKIKRPGRRLLGVIANDPANVLAVSPFILAEVGKALSYPHMQRVLGITPDEIHEHVAYIRTISRVVEPTMGTPVVLTDPQDDPVLYTAVSAGADVLCTRDRGFYLPNVIAFCRRYDMEIMNEIELLLRLRS